MLVYRIDGLFNIFFSLFDYRYFSDFRGVLFDDADFLRRSRRALYSASATSVPLPAICLLYAMGTYLPRLLDDISRRRYAHKSSIYVYIFTITLPRLALMSFRGLLRESCHCTIAPLRSLSFSQFFHCRHRPTISARASPLHSLIFPRFSHLMIAFVLMPRQKSALSPFVFLPTLRRFRFLCRHHFSSLSIEIFCCEMI